MRLLMIAWGYLPYTFSEGFCNGKFVYALKEEGVHTTVISKVDNGHTYSQTWVKPWDELKDTTVLIDYPLGNKLQRLADVAYSAIVMNGIREPGVRWARRAYQKACELLQSGDYDAVLTRSPNDITHVIGYKLKKKYDITWIANWNDPASPIWPGAYKINRSESEQIKAERLVEQLLKSADLNTFPSDSLRQHFITHFPFLKTTRTDVIPHIALSPAIWPRPASLRKNNRKMLMLHSGNLSSERNPENVFQAMRQLLDEGCSDFEFHIMGQINEYTGSLIEKYQLDSVVKCIGSFGYMDAIQIMQDYDVLVLIEALLEKGIFFASKFTDYAQAGKPILAVSPQIGFAKDMIGEYGGGVVADNTSIADIKGKIKYLIEKWENGRLTEISTEPLYANFESKNVTRRFINMIHDLIGK